MAEVAHRTVETNGLQMHLAESGKGPLVILCHGFAGSWYSWRHQLPALADAGFHVVAPDQRGYGKTDAPEAVDAYSMGQLVGDIVGLVHAMGEDQAVIVGHDWGALVAWSAAMVRPDLFCAVAAFSSPIQPRGPRPPIEQIRDLVGDRFNLLLYVQTPGVAEHELEHDVGATLRKMMVGLSGGNKYSPKPRPGGPPPNTAYLLESMIDCGDDLPSWLSSTDLAVHVETLERTGFRGPLNWYRNMDRNWEQGAAYLGKTIDQPALFMTGGRDFVPVDEAAMRAIVTDLQVFRFLEDIGHSTQEEAPTEVNQALLDFLRSLQLNHPD